MLEPENPPVRASDKERQRVADLLREHTSEGRLTMEEYEQRVESAYAAKTVAELRPLLADLPVHLDEVLPGQAMATHPSQQTAWRRENPDPWVRYAMTAAAVVLIVGALVAATRIGFAVWPLLLIGVFVFGGGGRGRRRHR